MGASITARTMDSVIPASVVRPVTAETSQVAVIPGGRGTKTPRPSVPRSGRRLSTMIPVRRLGKVVAGSTEMVEVLAMTERLAPTELTVTLIGETGTGKDVLAHTIH